MKMSGAQIIIETLIEQGCDTVFGYPGGAVLNIYDELYKQSDKIKHIITAHEQGAAHAADGYARVSGKVGVVMATSGPGATNLVTGIANAYLDSTPMVAITGNVALPLFGKDSFQEVDTTGITMPITKYNYIVKDVNEIADVVREAFWIAKSGRPGPVLIDVPKDVQIAVTDFSPSCPVEAKKPEPPSEESIQKAVEIIANAKRPYIYCGGGVVISEAGDEVLELSNKIDSPIGFSLMGLSAISSDNPNHLGMTGMHGRYASIKAKSEADLVIAVGVRFSDRATGDKSRYTKKTKFLHIDADAAEIDKNIPAYLGIVGDVKTVLKQLNKKVAKQTNPEWREAVAEMKRQELAAIPEDLGFHPLAIVRKTREFTADDTVIATDVGQHQMWTAQYYEFKKPRTFITSGGLGTMGFGMGAAIGSCVGKDYAPTVLFTGDGSFGMNLAETATAVSNNLPLIVVIMNNGVLGMVRQWQTLFFENRYAQTTLVRKTDFVKLAEAFGATGIRVTNMQEYHEALEKAYELKTPVVIDCVIDMDEKVLPMIPPGGSIDNVIVS